ncbi:MAG: hypothetical protein IPK52_07120 [Chloroflexi bacterium]|nr:hypothetical protein [Chloroflexota bacterium]
MTIRTIPTIMDSRVRLEVNYVCQDQLECVTTNSRFVNSAWEVSLSPMGYERQCFEEIRDDGSDLLTIDLHTGTHDVRLELTDEQRKLAAGDGWAKFLEFSVPMFRDEADKPK